MTDQGGGVYSATVSQNTSNNQITQFYVEATSGNTTTTQPKFGAERPAMWIVDSREMPNILLPVSYTHLTLPTIYSV